MKHGGEETLVHAALHPRQQTGLDLGHECKPFALRSDAWNAAVQKHEREVLRLFLAERVKPPGRVRKIPQGVRSGRHRQLGSAKLAEPFLGQRKEDVILRREVAVDRAGAITHLRRDVPNRHLGVPMGDEELERSVENGAPNSRRWLLPACLSAHYLPLFRDKKNRIY